jgi:hypothetical protein
VLEYNPFWGPHRCVTIPYDPNYRLDFSWVPYYCGASLAAFVALGREKGYRLVGCIREQFNAFFVRADLAINELPEVPASRCLTIWREVDLGDRAWVDVSRRDSKQSLDVFAREQRPTFEAVVREPQDTQIEIQGTIRQLQTLALTQTETQRIVEQLLVKVLMMSIN